MRVTDYILYSYSDGYVAVDWNTHEQQYSVGRYVAENWNQAVKFVHGRRSVSIEGAIKVRSLLYPWAHRTAGFQTVG